MLLYEAQEQMHGLLRNFPNRWLAAALRFAIFPRGRTFSAPSDELGQRVAELLINPTATRRRLADCTYITVEKTNPLGLLQQALERAEEIKPLERRVFDAKRSGAIHSEDTPGQIDEAEQNGILTPEEATRIREFDAMVMDLTGVDDFDAASLARKPPRSRTRATTKKRTKAKRKSARKRTATRRSGAPQQREAGGGDGADAAAGSADGTASDSPSDAGDSDPASAPEGND
jgi:acyl-CoA dehydrogenase